MYLRNMRKTFCIWNGCLALLLVACRSAPPNVPPTQVVRISETPRSIETSRPQATAIPSPVVSPSPTSALTAMEVPIADTQMYHQTFTMTGEQAHEVAVFMNFIRAYNAGQLDEALALLSEHVVGSDCDYRNGAVVQFQGMSQAADWLRERLSDNDRLIVSQISDQNADPSGAHVIGVAFSRRTSRTLAELGFEGGITSAGAAKVVFDTEPTLISAFANGPGGGSPAECRPGK